MAYCGPYDLVEAELSPEEWTCPKTIHSDQLERSSYINIYRMFRVVAAGATPLHSPSSQVFPQDGQLKMVAASWPFYQRGKGRANRNLDIQLMMVWE